MINKWINKQMEGIQKLDVRCHTTTSFYRIVSRYVETSHFEHKEQPSKTLNTWPQLKMILGQWKASYLPFTDGILAVPCMKWRQRGNNRIPFGTFWCGWKLSCKLRIFHLSLSPLSFCLSYFFPYLLILSIYFLPLSPSFFALSPSISPPAQSFLLPL